MSGCGARTAAGSLKAVFESSDVERFAWILTEVLGGKAARSASGGGTYDIKEARRTIRDYLADATTFAYSAERAQNAAISRVFLVRWPCCSAASTMR